MNKENMSKDKSDGQFNGMTLFEAAQRLISVLPKRSQAMLLGRFGISSKEPLTLEEIGRKNQVTRERVRQIIRDSLKKIDSDQNASLIKMELEKVEFTINANSGIMKEADLLECLAGDKTQDRGALNLFLAIAKNIQHVSETEGMSKSYAVKGFDCDKWNRVIENSVQILEEIGCCISNEDLFEKYSQKDAEISEQQLAHLLSVSKLVSKNKFGKWGKSSWIEVNPKGSREKALAVLKETGSPLHFRDITKLIDTYYPGKKKTHPQTVHNELIKDGRFVLVGRGIYALSDWGFKKGTVKDVLEEMISRKGRMKKDEILKEIAKIRQVKKSTVMINLNNFFVKVGKDIYAIKK